MAAPSPADGDYAADVAVFGEAVIVMVGPLPAALAVGTLPLSDIIPMTSAMAARAPNHAVRLILKGN